MSGMRLPQLSATLRREGVNRHAYRLMEVADDAYCLTREGGGWAVFYSERGERWDERSHAREEDAAADLFARIMRDPTTRQKRGA